MTWRAKKRQKWGSKSILRTIPRTISTSCTLRSLLKNWFCLIMISTWRKERTSKETNFLWPERSTRRDKSSISGIWERWSSLTESSPSEKTSWPSRWQISSKSGPVSTCTRKTSLSRSDTARRRRNLPYLWSTSPSVSARTIGCSEYTDCSAHLDLSSLIHILN